MPYAFPPVLKQLVEAQMTRGGYHSEDELLLDAVVALAELDRRQAELRAEIHSRLATSGQGLAKPLVLADFQTEARRRLAAEG